MRARDSILERLQHWTSECGSPMLGVDVFDVQTWQPRPVHGYTGLKTVRLVAKYKRDLRNARKPGTGGGFARKHFKYRNTEEIRRTHLKGLCTLTNIGPDGPFILSERFVFEITNAAAVVGNDVTVSA